MPSVVYRPCLSAFLFPFGARDGFYFIRHDTKVADFFNEAEVRRIYYPGDGSAGEGGERGDARCRVRPHAAHR